MILTHVNINWLLEIIFPRFCLGCNALGTYICSDCEGKIPFYDPQTCPYCESPSPYGLTHPRCQRKLGLDGMFVFSHYAGLVKQIIHEVKYEGYFAILEDLAEIMTKRYHNGFNCDYFVSVPLAQKRFNERSFNQAEKLGGYLINQIKQIKQVNLLVRTRETKPQFDLKYEDRKHNVINAFSLANNLKTRDLSGYSFCLIDDVATTGATIFECTKVLKRAGAEKVYGMVLARGGR